MIRLAYARWEVTPVASGVKRGRVQLQWPSADLTQRDNGPFRQNRDAEFRESPCRSCFQVGCGLARREKLRARDTTCKLVAEPDRKISVGCAKFHVDKMQQPVGAPPARHHINDRVPHRDRNRPIHLPPECLQRCNVDHRLPEGTNTHPLRRFKETHVLGRNKAHQPFQFEVRLPPIRSGHAEPEGNVVSDQRLDGVLAYCIAMPVPQVAVDQPDAGPGFVNVEQFGVRSNESIERFHIRTHPFPFSVSLDALLIRYNPDRTVGIRLGQPQPALFLPSLDPAFFAPDPNGGFLSPTHGQPFWGGGFQLGAYYILNCDWQFGLSYKSPQWFEEFEWQAVDVAGAPHNVTLQHRLPWILSFGSAYRGIDKTVVAVDVRYFDYGGSAPYGETVIAGGTGWDSIFSVAAGLERQIGNRCKVRFGYLYSENPVPDVLTLFNTELPAINQHQISLGWGIQVKSSISMDLAWVHGFKNSIRGPVPVAQRLGGATVALDQSFDALVAGMGINF